MKYRIKTTEEFQEEGSWDSRHNCPRGWNTSGRMNHLLGQVLPDDYTKVCKQAKPIYISDTYGNWTIQPRDYTVVESESQPLAVPGTDLVFDLARLATEVDDLFQTRLNIAIRKHNDLLDAAIDKTQLQMTDYLNSVNSTFKEIRTELLAELSRGRAVIQLGSSQSVSVQHLDHPEFEAVVQSLYLHHKAMLVGPAGTGKTYMVLEVSNRMKLPFYKYSMTFSII